MREMDFVARYGGEEFAAILPVTNQKEAVIASLRIRTAIEAATIIHEGQEFRVTCSLGVAQALGANSPAELIKRADDALYQSKAAGRNCSHFHDGQVCRPASEALEPAAPPAVQDAPAPAKSRQPAEEGEVEQESGFHADLRRRVAEARKFHVPLSLMMLEIDDFDQLSEKYGVMIGEQVYDTMGDFLRVVMQEMDVAARSGNGRFAVMMPGIDLDSALALAEQLRSAVEGHAMQVKGVDLRLTLSAGVAEILANDDSSTLTKRAAAALFAARKGGCNCIYSHNGEFCAAAAMAHC
jgi:diguanylate cyclase (GGDEF)-like protein